MAASHGHKNCSLSVLVGDPGIEPGVSRLEGVTVPCHTLRPVAHRDCGATGCEPCNVGPG